MATANDPQSPGRQNLEASYAYDDDWRPAEDESWDDWPTLISSVEHDPRTEPQDHVDSKDQAEADDAILNGIVSGGLGQSSRQTSQQASQQPPIKVLTRPMSSGKDPASGFSFTKAKPIQQFDFRRPKQAPVITQLPSVSGPLPDLRDETLCHPSPPLLETTQPTQNIDIAAPEGPSPERQDPQVLSDTPPVPFPDGTPTQYQANAYPITSDLSGPIKLDFSTSGIHPGKVATAAESTFPESHLDGEKQPPMLNIVMPNHEIPTTAATVSIHSPTEETRVVREPRVDRPNGSRHVSKDPLASVAGTPKITKSHQRKMKAGRATKGLPPQSNPKLTYTEDDLLKLLMYRRRQGQQELEYFRTTQHQKEAEIQRLREMSNNLSGELQKVLLRENQNAAELLRIKANKPTWESKIKRLSDYVKGLTNDHKRLREDVDGWQKQHTDVFFAGEELHEALEGVQKSAEKERIRSQKYEGDARHEIRTLMQTVQNQAIQLRSEESSLIAEKERGDRLEAQLCKVNANHEQSLQLFASHRDAITNKIDNLLQQAQSIFTPNKAPEPHSPDLIKPMLDQCLGMLQEFHEADAVKPEDFRKLNDTVDSFVRGIALSVEACEESSASVEVGQKQLTLAMQDHFRALSSTISSEHALSEQIGNLREVKATVRERLQTSESSLADARREIAALRLKDEEQSRKVSNLEVNVAQAQSRPAEVLQALLRIQELDSRNRDLQNEIFNLRKETSDLSSQIEQKSVEATEVNERLSNTQEKLEAAHEETARWREEKSASARKVMLEREQLITDLSKAGDMQLASLRSEHMNVVERLKLETSSAEKEIKNISKQVDILRAEKHSAELETSKLQAMLKEVQNEKEAVVGTRKALQLHLQEMEVRMQEKNTEHQDMQIMLKKANDRVGAKDLEIIALQALPSTRNSSSRVIDQSDTVRGVHSTNRGCTPHRDSQQSLVDHKPSIRPTSSNSSRHFTKRPSVIEDSQPTQKPNFMSLDDLVLEDPFANYAQEGPQTIAGEDISHLFPSTPGHGSQAKDFNYSRKSVVHTTVVSETQRRQHQLFREATPHTNSHALTKPRSQSQARTYPITDQNEAMPRSSVTTSSSKSNFPHHDPMKPRPLREASVTQDSTHARGNVKDIGQGKRNTLAAGFNNTNSQARPSKVHKADPAKPAKALGPVIQDSQSPLLNGRHRKMTRRKSSAPRVDKFARRFAQD